MWGRRLAEISFEPVTHLELVVAAQVRLVNACGANYVSMNVNLHLGLFETETSSKKQVFGSKKEFLTKQG